MQLQCNPELETALMIMTMIAATTELMCAPTHIAMNSVDPDYDK